MKMQKCSRSFRSKIDEKAKLVNSRENVIVALGIINIKLMAKWKEQSIHIVSYQCNIEKSNLFILKEMLQ